MIECPMFSHENTFLLTHCFKVASGSSKKINKQLIRLLLEVVIVENRNFQLKFSSARVKDDSGF